MNIDFRVKPWLNDQTFLSNIVSVAHNMGWLTLVPEVFLDFSPNERVAREPRSGKHESRSGEQENPLVTLDLNLTFIQTPGSGF